MDTYPIVNLPNPFDEPATNNHLRHLYLYNLVTTAESLIEYRVERDPNLALRIFDELSVNLNNLLGMSNYLTIFEPDLIPRYRDLLTQLSEFLQNEINKQDQVIHDAIAQREKFQHVLTGTRNLVDTMDSQFNLGVQETAPEA